MEPRILFALIALGCNGTPETTDDVDTDTDEVGVETECADGDDNDADGAVDCEDADCADYFRCALPDQMSHETVMAFKGRTIECKLAGIGFDYDVDDCVTTFTAALTYAPEDSSCGPCDRIYKGPLTWLEDSCSELLGENGPKPETTEYGVRFDSETTRTLYLNDPTTGWAESVVVTRDGDRWVNQTVVPIEEDIEACNNGVQYLGDLTADVSFEDQ